LEVNSTTGDSFITVLMGKLIKVVTGKRERIYALKLIERVLRIEKSFIPERIESGRFKICQYRESCSSVRSPFASKFL